MPSLYPFWTSDQRTNYQTLCARLFSSQANLLTISHFTQQQMSAYCRGILGLDKKAELIKLASSGGLEPFHYAGANIVQTKHSFADTDPVFKIINQKGFKFALMVSSYQKRKNQIPLLNVWRQAIQDISHPPALIFAGLHCDPDYEAALIELIGGDPNVILFFDLPDEAFDLLYRNCLFTLFPSQGEGWGLPISESLGYGKYCLTANNTSLLEVGEGVIFAADLVENEAEWISEIRKLLVDKSYLKQKSDAIKANISHRTWNDLAADVLRAALTPGLIQG